MEIIGSQIDENLQTFAEHSPKTWGKFCGISAKKFTKFAEILKKNGLIIVEIFPNSIRVNIPNILKYLDEGTKKKLRNSGIAPESLRNDSGQEHTRTEEEEEKKEESPPTPPRGGEGADSGKPALASKPGSQEPLLPAQVTAAYHEILPELPKVCLWSSQMILDLTHNGEIDPERLLIGFWRGLFKRVRDLPALMGTLKETRARGQPFKASLPRLLKPDNVAKILNGYYSEKSAATTLSDERIPPRAVRKIGA